MGKLCRCKWLWRELCCEEVLEASVPRKRAQQQISSCTGLGFPHLQLPIKATAHHCLAMSFIWGSGMGKSPQSTPFSWGWEWAINFQIEDRADPNTCRKWTFPVPNRCLLYNVETMNGRGSFCDAVSRNTQAEFTEDYQDLPRNQQFLGMPAVPPQLRMFVTVKHMSNKLQKSN